MTKSDVVVSEKKKSSISLGGFGYFLGGAVIGGCLGILFAPKAGSETRSDLGRWGKDASTKAKSLGSKIYESIPTRVKAAAGFGAVKAGLSEGIREVKSASKDMLHDVKKQASERLG